MNFTQDPNWLISLWISRTRDAILKARCKELIKYGISARQASVIFIIHALGNKATPANIARGLFREAHTVSEFLTRMERDGLVSKSENPERKNAIIVRLTKKGLKAYRQSTKLESIQSVISVLSEKENQQLRRLLRNLWFKALEDLGMSPRPPFPGLK